MQLWYVWTQEIRTSSDSGSKILIHCRSSEKDADTAWNASERNVSTAKTTAIFKDIKYFIHRMGNEKQLLQDVSKFVKPGPLFAPMGSSGAGKTSLMDVLAQRKDSGQLERSVMVNEKPRAISVQRMTG